MLNIHIQASQNWMQHKLYSKMYFLKGQTKIKCSQNFSTKWELNENWKSGDTVTLLHRTSMDAKTTGYTADLNGENRPLDFLLLLNQEPLITCQGQYSNNPLTQASDNASSCLFIVLSAAKEFLKLVKIWHVLGDLWQHPFILDSRYISMHMWQVI